jgi:HEAT repeat protein
MLVLLVGCGLSPQARARNILEQGLADPSNVVRINAAVGLNSEAAHRLLTEIFIEGDHQDRAAVLMAIKEDAAVLSESLIVDACRSVNPAVRENAYRVVVNSTFENKRELLLQGIEDELTAVRVLSYGALSMYGERELLQQGMRDREPRVRIASAKALAELGRPDMAEFIKDELKKSTPDLLGTGIVTMAQLGDTASIPLFKALLKESAGELRIDAAEALLILGDKTGIKALSNGLRSRDPFVRIHTTEVLTRHKVEETLPQLEAATRDEFVNVAVQALKALVEHEPRAYQELYAELMDAQNPLLRITAAKAYLRSMNGA